MFIKLLVSHVPANGSAHIPNTVPLEIVTAVVKVAIKFWLVVIPVVALKS